MLFWLCLLVLGKKKKSQTTGDQLKSKHHSGLPLFATAGPFAAEGNPPRRMHGRSSDTTPAPLQTALDTRLVQTTAGALRLPSPCQLGVFLTQQTPTHVFVINFIRMHSNTKPAFMLAEPKQGLCPQEVALNCFSKANTSPALATHTMARGGKQPPRQPSHTVLPPFCSIPWAPHLPTELLRPSVRAIPA